MSLRGQVKLVGLTDHRHDSLDVGWADFFDRRLHSQRLEKRSQILLVRRAISRRPHGVVAVAATVLISHRQ